MKKKYGDQASIYLTQKLIVAPSGTDPAALDEADPGAIFIGNAINGDPNPIPVAGGFLYVDNNGNLKFKGANGTVTQLAGA